MKSKSSLLLNLAVGTISILGVGATAHAQHRDSCPETIRHDQHEVDKAVDRYGYDSPQAQHERAELQRDSANCGYNEYGYQNQYYHGDWDDRRYQGNDGYRDYNQRGERYDPAYENGYRDGVNIGQQDARKGKSFRPQKHDEFEDGDRGYNRSYGDKGQYKSQYRQGFQNGYSDGYGR